MQRLVPPMVFLSLLLSGAIFGFFYAWICSTMWGLDVLNPNDAIAAMNVMNNSVSNFVFAPAFFGTPVVLILTGVLAFLVDYKRSGILIGAAGLLYLFGALILTVNINVPLNRELYEIQAPLPLAEAQAIWDSYSSTWEFWNTARTIVAGFSLFLVALGLYALPRRAV